MKRVVFYKRFLLAILCIPFTATSVMSPTLAAENNFALQVSPSPLVSTVKPGEKRSLELKIRNASNADEKLKIEARSFTFDNSSGEVTLDDTLAPDFAQWLTLPDPGFTVAAGQWQTQTISVDLPKDTGFSYSFALIISRNDTTASTSNGRLLKGSVAVFTLINVDRPDAVRKMELTSLQTDQRVYEYLPATISIKLKNTGNTIVRPYGNLFIQQGDTDNPLKTLPVNESQSYILPNTERTLTATWADGFPVYQTTTRDNGVKQTNLEWNIDQIRHFRFGQYTAKVVAVYNDGTRDVPITGEVTFWVIPWKTLLIILVVVIGLVMVFRRYLRLRTDRAVKKALAARQKESNE